MKNNIENFIKNYQGNNLPKIDLHVHYLPQAYREALLNCGEINPDGYPTPAWNPEQHLELMEHLGITTSMLSLSSPHINFGDKNATKILARKVNDDGAELVDKYPQRFGLMAALPLPDVEDSIAEIRYAMEVLHADGFALPTNTRGIYLGNPCLDPILEELNRYQAVAVLHPNTPGSVPENVVEGLPMPMMEFLFDTTRTVINLILKRTLRRFPNIKFVIPHAGAFLAILADRFGAALQMLPTLFEINGQKRTDNVDIFAGLNHLYYDVAGVCLPRQLGDLLQIIDVNHLFYGSDYPYTPEPACLVLADALDKTNLLTEEQRRSIYYDNAVKLFPNIAHFE
jgi:predicted TIM-barrel fold metal-dependent hydrolase